MKTNLDTKKIEKEIKEIINTLIMNFEALNTDAAFNVYDDSPDFSMIASDGSCLDYKTFFNGNKNYLENCSNFKLNTIKEKIKILSNDLVLFSWIYKAEATLKTGEKNIWDKAGASFLFKKIDDNWKVIYYHESSLPPATK
jgi:ketosteroid isomerase-like protein